MQPFCRNNGTCENRLSVEENETGFEKGSDVWVERTSESHFPHIRLHGGALEDDPILD